MKLTEKLIEFIEEHALSDTNRLLLDAARFPDISVPFAVEQIASRRQIKDKLPSWYANKALIFPSKIAAEQCSSEQTAYYKQALINETDHLCDLTGGLGIDSYSFSRKAERVTYIERFSDYAEAARQNYEVLKANNITVLNGDGEQLIAEVRNVDVFYIDPARRGEGNKRVFALTDCEPDLVVLLPRLFEYAPKVIAKISPMADISQTLSLLPNTAEVHVLSVRNECKELLFVIDRGLNPNATSRITCTNLKSDGGSEQFIFTQEEEQLACPTFAKAVGCYLYEPNASILKAGAFKILTQRFPVKKLHTNSHLYTSDEFVPDFPGRSFKVEETLPFSSALCKSINKTIPQANIAVRNFPLPVDTLRKKTKIKDGGEIYLFATTLSGDNKVIVKTKKAETE